MNYPDAVEFLAKRAGITVIRSGEEKEYKKQLAREKRKARRQAQSGKEIKEEVEANV